MGSTDKLSNQGFSKVFAKLLAYMYDVSDGRTVVRNVVRIVLSCCKLSYQYCLRRS